MSEFTLGQRVKFTHVLRRTAKDWDGVGWAKIWETDRADHRFASGPIIPQTGIVVGLRNLSNGRADYNGPEEQRLYVHKENVRAVMIVTDLRRRAVFAPIEAVEAVRA